MRPDLHDRELFGGLGVQSLGIKRDCIRFRDSTPILGNQMENGLIGMDTSFPASSKSLTRIRS